MPERLIRLMQDMPEWRQNMTKRNGLVLANASERVVYSPHISSTTEVPMIRAELYSMTGIGIGGRYSSNLRYADDTTLIADNKKENEQADQFFI